MARPTTLHPLDLPTRLLIRKLVERDGEVFAATQLEVSRQTLARALAALPLRRDVREALFARIGPLLEPDEEARR